MPETKVKICGITNAKDALNAVELGADFLGFNFFKKSPRFVAPQKAKAIIKELPNSVKTVGVFVNETLRRINLIAKKCSLDIVQLHGNETPAFCEQVFLPVIKAFRIKDNDSFRQIDFFKTEFILLDAFSAAKFGGTGKQIEKKFFPQIKRVALHRKLFISGGSNAENVHSIVAEIKPFGVDVASGTEIAPGVKDKEKMGLFISEAKK